ncbi:MAG: hypothetical protein JXR78_01975 [Victivallales bacterium]|nr:hypothetical protein [Victivallales bacterium]
MRGIIGGCGCFVFILIVAIGSFVLGVIYGPGFREATAEKSSAIIESFKKAYSTVSGQMESARETARALSGSDDNSGTRRKKEEDSNSSDFDLKKYF